MDKQTCQYEAKKLTNSIPQKEGKETKNTAKNEGNCKVHA
jgi:hypothetical protein